ncbi:carbohydrate-binding domain-containing protein [Ruminococcus sp.]|uniref:carbohydrate-binding domain-containing protein n=1 Tax=Ruminococcus sp. TaxID=41978 RepID=UPI0025DAD327|nr:carbohydrate-binding domain-containing protein [Ruminococcus sp.]MCR4639560.1 carbohydrate-binding domain-containing protein [Ruminococcus sp.]
MKYSRLWAAAAAITMIFSGYSCGKDNMKASSVTDSTVSDSTETTTKNDKKKQVSSETDNKDTTTTTTAKKEEKSDKKTTTTKAGEKKSDTTTTAKKDGAPKSESSSGGGSSNNNNTSQGGSASEGGAPAEAVKEYAAEIDLGSGGAPKVNGSNVTVDGSVITITAGGDYIFTGGLTEGQIRVNTGASEDKVTVVLNGVDITNSSAPAIFIEEAKRCTIKPKEGSVNYITSGVEKKGNTETGAIFSNDTIRLKGNGGLNITANASHGINSDDDVIIESGTYNIESRKSGIIANDDITINDGNIIVNGGTNGIKSKGTLNINGGFTVLSGGTKEEKSSIYAASSFSFKGGCVYAAGSKVSVPTHSDFPYIVADLGETVGAGSSVELFLNGNSMITMNPHNDFRCVMMLAPEVSGGSSFAVSVNGNRSQDFTVSDGGNQFSLQ